MQGGTPTRGYKRARMGRLAAWARSIRAPIRRPRLARMAIGARVHTFKRVSETFGFVTQVSGSGILPELVNAGGGTNEFLLNVANGSQSQFQQGAYQFGGSLQFMLKHVANFAEITNLFDNYRIKSVYVKVIPGFNSSDVVGTLNIPIMHYTVDVDDASVPLNRTEVLQNSKCKSVRLDQPFTIAFKPRAQTIVQSQANAGATQIAGGLLPMNTWLDTSNQVVPHFGVKFWMDEFPNVSGSTAAKGMVKFSVTYILETKNVV